MEMSVVNQINQMLPLGWMKPFLGIDNSNSYLQLGCLSVDVESRFQNCKVADGNSQVEARHNRGVFSDAASDARPITRTDTFPSRFVPSSLQIFALRLRRRCCTTGTPKSKLMKQYRFLSDLKHMKNVLSLGSSRIPNFSKTTSFC